MTPNTQTRQAIDRHPFLLSVEDVARQLGTNIETGLSARQVAELRNEFPPNELEGGGGVSWYKILIKQISNAMILVSQAFFREGGEERVEWEETS
jgi:P-type Na+/K+ transporter